VRWTDLSVSAYNDVYTVTADLCNSIPCVDGFDVAPSTGKLAIVDYAEGCPGHQGLYTVDKDGKDLQVLVDGKAIPAWSGVQEVFWSPDENRIALKVSYNWQCCLMVLDMSKGQLAGWIYFDQRYDLGSVALHGWSPDGRWLLCSYWQDLPSQGMLSKIRVTANGSLDTTSVVTLLSGAHINGATWGNLAVDH
jgi:Tol biopolymer transport system component